MEQSMETSTYQRQPDTAASFFETALGGAAADAAGGRWFDRVFSDSVDSPDYWIRVNPKMLKCFDGDSCGKVHKVSRMAVSASLSATGEATGEVTPSELNEVDIRCGNTWDSETRTPEVPQLQDSDHKAQERKTLELLQLQDDKHQTQEEKSLKLPRDDSLQTQAVQDVIMFQTAEFFKEWAQEYLRQR